MRVLRETLAALGVLFAVGVAAVHYGALPQRVPVHFDARGAVNGWGDKSSLWMVAGVACALYAGMTLLGLLPASMINVPVSPERRAAAVPMAMEMVGWLKAEMVWIFAWLCAAMVRMGQGRGNGLSIWFLPVVLVVVFGTVALYLWRMRSIAA